MKEMRKGSSLIQLQPCFEAGIRELPFLMPEPAEKPSLQMKEMTVN